jgi:hemerythrin
MTDKADKDAEELLPNAWWARSAVAAKLRERDAHHREIFIYAEQAVKIRDQEISRLKAENASCLEALKRLLRDWENAIDHEPQYMKMADYARRIIKRAEINRAKGESA